MRNGNAWETFGTYVRLGPKTHLEGGAGHGTVMFPAAWHDRNIA